MLDIRKIFCRKCIFYQLVNIYIFLFNNFENCFRLDLYWIWLGDLVHLSFNTVLLENPFQIDISLDSCGFFNFYSRDCLICDVIFYVYCSHEFSNHIFHLYLSMCEYIEDIWQWYILFVALFSSIFLVYRNFFYFSYCWMSNHQYFEVFLSAWFPILLVRGIFILSSNYDNYWNFQIKDNIDII